MQGALLVLVPAMIISLGVITFKLKFPNFNVMLDAFSIRLPTYLIVILALAISSTFSINYIYCDLLQTKCEPEALAAIGYIFHFILVFIFSTLLAVFFNKLFKKDK